MLDNLALIVIALAGVYLLGLGGLSLAAPARARRFLASFASSASAHYLELAARMLVGASVLQFSPQMQYSQLFDFVGWVLVVTTILLLAIPWYWHRAIARRAVPIATAHLGLFALASAAMGSFVLLSAFFGTD